MNRILIIDDDKNTCDILKKNLEKDDFQITVSGTGKDGLNCFNELHPHIVFLDVMLPDIDGWRVCREIRQKNSTAYIIFITAKGDIYNKEMGFDAGADDYIVKPFEVREVVARTNAALRRLKMTDSKEGYKELYYEGIHIDLTKYELTVKGKIIDTPPKELELLFFLASNPNRVYTRDQLLDEVWGFEYYGDSRTIDVHIKRLREKIEGASKKWRLKTVWGVGYKFESE